MQTILLSRVPFTRNEYVPATSSQECVARSFGAYDETIPVTLADWHRFAIKTSLYIRVLIPVEA